MEREIWKDYGKKKNEEVDFCSESNYRETIFNREEGICFYCLKRLTKENYVLDHVQPQIDKGSNNYRNVVWNG